MIVYISVCRFYLGTAGKADDSAPIVLVQNKTVLDLNRVAEDRGIRLGMGKAEAKAIVPDATFEEWEADPYREAQRRWLDVCCRHTDVVEPQGQHDAYLDLSGHPDPADVLRRLRQDLRDGLGWETRTGAADVKWIARLACDLGDESLSAWRDPLGFLAPLPVSRLTPVPPEHRERLEFLGYRHIGHALRIPLSTLRAQFGEGALTIYRAVRGGMSEPVRAAYPLRSASARCRFDPPADLQEALDAGLRQMADQLAQRLCAVDLQGSNLRLVVEFESGPVVAERQFSKPMQGSVSVLFGLRRLLETVEVGQPVERMAAQMDRLAPSERRQLGLYAVRPNRPESVVQGALNSLRKTFGENAVMLAADKPESRSQRVLKAWKEGLGWT